MALVGTREINNVMVEIHASKHGTWSISLPPEEGDVSGRGRGLAEHGTSLEACVNKARQEIKRLQVKVDVPFKTREGLRGRATGRHARSRDKILTELQDGTKEHIGYRDQVFKADMPKSVFEHLDEIEVEVNKLQSEKREIIEQWRFDLGKAVDAAIIEATEEKVNA